jgi:hypothetical protein
MMAKHSTDFDPSIPLSDAKTSIKGLLPMYSRAVYSPLFTDEIREE